MQLKCNAKAIDPLDPLAPPTTVDLPVAPPISSLATPKPQICHEGILQSLAFPRFIQ